MGGRTGCQTPAWYASENCTRSVQAAAGPNLLHIPGNNPEYTPQEHAKREILRGGELGVECRRGRPSVPPEQLGMSKGGKELSHWRSLSLMCTWTVHVSIGLKYGGRGKRFGLGPAPAWGVQNGPFGPASEDAFFLATALSGAGASPQGKVLAVLAQGLHSRAMNTVCRPPNTSLVCPSFNRCARPGAICLSRTGCGCRVSG